MALTKNDIINTIQNELGQSTNQCYQIVETLLGIIKRTLENGEDILISRFGKFCVKCKNERHGRNPATGEELMIEPRKVVTYKCSAQLRERINGWNKN